MYHPPSSTHDVFLASSIVTFTLALTLSLGGCLPRTEESSNATSGPPNVENADTCYRYKEIEPQTFVKFGVPLDGGKASITIVGVDHNNSI